MQPRRTNPSTELRTGIVGVAYNALLRVKLRRVNFLDFYFFCLLFVVDEEDLFFLFWWFVAGVTPVPIPNTAVKPGRTDGSGNARVGSRQNKKRKQPTEKKEKRRQALGLPPLFCTIPR